MRDLNRRDFLSRSGAVLAGGAVSTGAACVSKDQPAPHSKRWDLRAAWIDKTLDGTKVRLRAYNEVIPGPVITARPGEQLHVRVRNRLTAYDSTGWNGDHNVPHMLDTTNLHLHGLEIVPHLFEPVGTPDTTSEMIAIPPGKDKDYFFQIPDDQPPGLFWYHPHHHGSTAVQAVSGMAGGIIISGDIDEVPEIKAARDIPIVIQDIGLFPSESEPDLWLYEPRQNAIWNTLKSQVYLNGRAEPTLQGGFTTGDYKLRYFLINGEPFYKEVHNEDNPLDPVGTQLPVPRFNMKPGEVARFRMLNANSDGVTPIVFEDHELHLIALDGVNFSEPRTLPVKGIEGKYGDQQLLLAPANRAEFLFKANDKPGIYQVVQLQQDQQFLISSRRVLAEIEIAGDPVSMEIPDKLPIPRRHYPLIKTDEVKRTRKVVFSMGFPPVLNKIVGLDFMVNNQLYDEEAIDMTVDLGSAEEWRISVPDEQNGGSEGHPFHVHVNSFEVISIDGKAQPPGTIQDTIWVQKNTEVIIRMKFRQWTGKSVYHCHILPHKDTGMMQNFLIRG